ncbi:uncharacterized protein LOC143430749 [Xylocopa sonorina]|uniref:uncharacterized protein LOC143430749 n=1 Tax=Xylocopa sonorina TaxID=1818115 RepID=UPI00403B208F
MEESQEQAYPNNVLLFRLAISNSFKCIAESVSQEDFQNILTILKSKPTIVQKLHKTMFTELFETMNSDLSDILDEGSLRDGMEKVAKLSDANSSVTEDAWRPPGNVSLHLRSLDAHNIKEESKLLENRINDMEEENAVLMQKIADKRSKIIAMNDSITRSLSRSSIVIDLLEKRLEGLEKCLMLLNQE